MAEAAVEESEIEQSGKKPKKLIIILIAFVVLILGAGGTWWFFLKESPTAPVEEVVLEEPKPTKVYTIRLGNTGKPPYFLTYLSSEKSDDIFMEIHIEANTRDRYVKYALKKHMPLIISRLSSLFLEQSVANMRTVEGRKKLHLQVTEIVKQIMQDEYGEPGIDHIVFLEFVMS